MKNGITVENMPAENSPQVAPREWNEILVPTGLATKIEISIDGKLRYQLLGEGQKCDDFGNRQGIFNDIFNATPSPIFRSDTLRSYEFIFPPLKFPYILRITPKRQWYGEDAITPFPETLVRVNRTEAKWECEDGGDGDFNDLVFKAILFRM